MSCTKCQTLPTLPKNGGDLIISCDVPELADKMIDYLNNAEINYHVDDPQTLTVPVYQFKLFLRELCETQRFNKIERSAIHLLFLDHGEPLSPSKLRMMKSLQQYKDLAGAEYLTSLISNGALTTHFQPIIDLSNDTIFGYESLARGVNDTGELIYPDTLFRWGREGNMLFYLDRACRESSLKTAAVKSIKNKVFINFIPTAIYDPEHCLQSTVKWAKQLEFDPKNIIFEVIESDHVEDLDHLKRILDFYTSQGYYFGKPHSEPIRKLS